MGISVSKKVGNAVVRNRVKRRLRDLFRRTRADFSGQGVDIAVNARPSAADAPFEELARDYAATLQRALSRSRQTA